MAALRVVSKGGYLSNHPTITSVATIPQSQNQRQSLKANIF